MVNDLVYVVDGSWSVGVSDFDSAKQWLINITSQFDISPAYTQVKSTPACRRALLMLSPTLPFTILMSTYDVLQLLLLYFHNPGKQISSVSVCNNIGVTPGNLL